MVCTYKEGEQIFDVIQYISSVIYFFQCDFSKMFFTACE